MDPNVLVMDHVSKAYVEKGKKTQALSDFSLEVPRGGFVTLMGASGCGKSTVTKILDGIEVPDEGRIFIDGTEIINGKIPLSLRSRIGYVFQMHNLADWRSVEGNLMLPLEMYYPKKELKEMASRVDKYLDFVGLTKYRNVFPRELSGGMKQRVGIARALMTEPDILILDQPFGALDAITRGMLSAKVCKMVQQEKKTVLMVTSDIDEASRYSDIIYVMEHGALKQIIRSDIPAERRLEENFKGSDDYRDIKMALTKVIYSDN